MSAAITNWQPPRALPASIADTSDDDNVWPNTPLPAASDLMALQTAEFVRQGVQGVSAALWLCLGLALLTFIGLAFEFGLQL